MKKKRGEMRMKIQPPNLTEPLEGGNLLYDLVQMQQQDEEELRGGIYRNQLLGLTAAASSLKTASFTAASFHSAAWTIFPSPMCCWKIAAFLPAICRTLPPVG